MTPLNKLFFMEHYKYLLNMIFPKNLGKDIVKELDEGDKIVRTELGIFSRYKFKVF